MINKTVHKLGENTITNKSHILSKWNNIGNIITINASILIWTSIMFVLHNVLCCIVKISIFFFCMSVC